MIKWIILFVTVCVITPEDCLANITEPLHKEVNCPEIITSSNNNVICSLVSLFRFCATNLAEDISHYTIDKKSFIYLLFYQQHDNVGVSGFINGRSTSMELFFTPPKQTNYYVYALRKIIV